MFIPAIIKQQEKQAEKRLEIPDYTQQYYEYLEKKKEKQENNKPETVIHIQIY
jgi:hypothetical protein